MTGVPLPALDGRTPLGFLAALGVLRLITEHTGRSARLAWSPADATAVLHDARTDLDALVEDLTAIVTSIPSDGVLLETSTGFPPLGTAPDKLRMARPAFTGYASQVTELDGAAGERWLGSLVTDLSIDKESRIDISLYIAPSGKQSMRTMLSKSLNLIRNSPGLLREALVAWRRYPAVTGEYLDHRVLYDAADTPDGKTDAERGVPGATWLALMSYPLLRTTAVDARPVSTCWQHLNRRLGRRMIYPLWSAPLDTAAVQALLSHPVLVGAEAGPPPPLATLLSVFWIGHAARRKIAGRKSSGVLVPITSPGRPAVLPGATR